MATVIGVVGPPDLVHLTCEVFDEFANATPYPQPYEHEDETTQLVRDSADRVDGWLFTGVVPHEIASAAGLLVHPARFVDYTGATLLRALVALLHDGHDISRLSVDTLEEASVYETLREAGLATDEVHVLPYAATTRSRELIGFHENARDEYGTKVALTCVRSVYEVLREDMTALRLVPSIHSIREALGAVLMDVLRRELGDAQVVLGLLQLEHDEPALSRQLALLGGSVKSDGNGRYTLVTTRGPLERYTESFTQFPLMGVLGEQHSLIRVGFGIGRSAAEAEALAKEALDRALSSGDKAAAISMRNGRSVLLEGDKPLSLTNGGNVRTIAKRTGMSGTTLLRLRELGSSKNDQPITTRDVADGFNVKLRTARRMLSRLETAGVAEVVGTQALQTSGRPLLLYRLHL